jgi:protein-arginine kinase activator protein McsA
MVCEQCHEREATVHVTKEVAPSGTMTKHDYCESCFSQTDMHAKAATAGWTSYSPPQSKESDEPEL